MGAMETDCEKCLHQKVCALWRAHESQDASCFSLDGCDYFDATLTPPNEWVSVEERLPEQENTQVLMTDGECCYISSRNNMVRFLDCEGIFIPGKAGAGVKVTHWMPLPAPPDRRPPEAEEEP